jgi:tetratricopeptide (TPR) repeat protein
VKKGLAIFALPALLFLFAVPLFALSPSGEEAFFRANEAYRDGDYEAAAEGYRSLLDEKAAKGHLFYNLGNTYFRMDDPGRAILFYERARALLPRDADLRFNLEYARDRLRDAVPADRDFLGEAFFWIDVVTGEEVFWLFALVNLLFWTVLLLRRFSSSEALYYGFVVLFILWLTSGASLAMKWHRVATDDRAVVLPAETLVRAGPDRGDTVLFRLHAGTVVRRERSELDWSLISLAGGKRGWTESKSVENIAE